MTPVLMERARRFKEAYLAVQAAFDSGNVLTVDDILPLCVTMNKAECDFIVELLSNMVGTPSYDYLRMLFAQVRSIIDIPEMFENPRTYDNMPDIPARGEDLAARLELFASLCRGSEWFTDHYPPLNVGRLAGVLDDLRNWLNAIPTKDNIPDAIVSDNCQLNADTRRDIPRSQSIALLYAVFVRLGVTQTHSNTAIARLIEAVTGGNIRPGKNAYSWTHRSDKLRDDVAALLDEFLNGGQSPI